MILQKHNPGMGMIPSWQLATDPGINIKLNPHVSFPPGMTQMSTQPLDMEPPIMEAGLGAMMSMGQRPSNARGCCDGGVEPDACCGAIAARRFARFHSPGMHGVLDFVDNPLFRYRKWIVLGGVALVGLAILGGAGALLK
jgi:hypothetical protein